MAKTPIQIRQASELPASNHIINGNFDFWQRGIGPLAVSSSAPKYLADRFRCFNDAASALTFSKNSSVPTLAQSGFLSTGSLHVQTAVSPSALTSGYVSGLNYAFEGYDYAHLHGGKISRLSFWVKSSVTGTYSVNIRAASGNKAINYEYAVNAANTWEHKTVDFTTETATTDYNFDHNLGITVSWMLGCHIDRATSAVGSWYTGTFVTSTTAERSVGATSWHQQPSATFQLAQVALYQGNFGTAVVPFSRVSKTIADEFSMCERYYEERPWDARIQNADFDASASTRYFGASFATPKRANPTISAVGYFDLAANQLQAYNTSANPLTVTSIEGINTTHFSYAVATGSPASNGAYRGYYRAHADF
jgi:hypothetical protein